ncbi:MAG: SDR family NAD(P)-dependent oxidoreductase [Candidatus Latescibacterota bacterium]|nr:SDR family NAD(P)-dependent oxidoreductase [Candidatus Latescibacterota bacterium]
MRTETLEGKTALITGAGQGMGLAVALKLASLGANIAINDIDDSRTESAVKAVVSAGHNATSVAADITTKTEVCRMVDKTISALGSLDILINNAGILYTTSVAEIPEDEWDRVIEVNLKGTFLCAQAVLPVMKLAGWGRIVNFSSTAGKNVSTVGGAHYTASKAGVLGFTRHLAKEVAADGITVNAVCPGLIDTEMVRKTIDADRTKAYADSFPITRLGKPTEVADLVAFLASYQAAYITGASLDINGGDLMI